MIALGTRRRASLGAIALVTAVPGGPIPAMEPAATQALTAAAFNAAGMELSLHGRTVSWATSNAAVATVAVTGHGTALVTAVAEGTCNITPTVDGVAGTAVAFEVEEGAGGGGDTEIPADNVALFNWLTGTGTGDAAVRDTDRDLPWDMQSGNGALNTVIASTGLDFPCSRVYKCIAESSGGAIQTNKTDQLRLEHENLHLPIPAIGESLFYRWYQRYLVPDSIDSSDSTPHSVQDGPAASTNNWMWETPVGSDGTWTPQFNFGVNAYPNNRWSTPALLKNQTYRVEFQVKRVGTSTFEPHCRIYDSDDVLVRSDADFVNRDGSKTFASIGSLTLRDIAYLAGWQMGNNGPSWRNVTAGQHPYDMWCFGAARVRTDDWIGPHIAAEEDA